MPHKNYCLTWKFLNVWYRHTNMYLVPPEMLQCETKNLFGNILIRSEIILCPFRHPVYVWLVTQLEILMAHMEAQGKIGLLRSSVMRILRSKIHCRKRVSLLLTILQYKKKMPCKIAIILIIKYHHYYYLIHGWKIWGQKYKIVVFAWAGKWWFCCFISSMGYCVYSGVSCISNLLPKLVWIIAQAQMKTIQTKTKHKVCNESYWCLPLA